MSRRRDLSPNELVDRWLDKRRVDASDSTISTYWYRLKLWLEWCDTEGIDSVSDLDGWDLERYETHRRAEGLSPNTLKNELITLRNLLEYGARIDVVDHDLPDKVDPPDVPPGAKSSDTMLTASAAEALLAFYRDSSSSGTRSHALLELLWYTGARAGGIVALDLRDYSTTDQYVDFHHRPETGTPLKNGLEGERPVGLPLEVCDALDEYVRTHRDDVDDEHGRQPLITSEEGRPTTGTIRDWTYQATIPCRHSECPHGKDPDTCEWTGYGKASKCPSSRSPHQIRTGAITWMLDRGLPVEVVAERVNATVEVIREHYDKAAPLEQMERRRRPYLDRLGFDNDTDQS